MKTDSKRSNDRRIRCTLADIELEECYHTRPDSLKTTLIVKYCLGDYKGCEIYISNKGNGNEDE